MASEIPKSEQFKNYCAKCDYGCISSGDFKKHLATLKHNAQKCSKMLGKTPGFVCKCGKTYKHVQSLNRHVKICDFEEEETNKIIETPTTQNKDEINYKEMLMTILNENKELRKQVTELIPKVGSNNSINSNNNIKQKFNIQIFLNEQCKDAINMQDFVKSIQISLEQLDITKSKGLTEGLSNAIIENMNKLSVYERPLHCTDVKRETLYVKDNNKWEKDESKEQIKKAIKDVSGKQYKALRNWMKENPDYKEDDSKQDYFAKALSVIGKDINAIDDKVVKNLLKNTYIKDNIE